MKKIGVYLPDKLYEKQVDKNMEKFWGKESDQHGV